MTKGSSIFSARRSTSFRISVLCFGRFFKKKPESNEAWEQRLRWIKSYQNYRNFNRIDGEPMEFEWKKFPGCNTLQLSDEVKSLLYRLGETPENFTVRILFTSMFNDISCGSRDNERECLANAEVVKRKLLTTENWLRKLYEYSMNNNTSTEDKHETNHIINKYNDTNTDTRKLHNL